eukprot:673819-Prorocentrum_minimum.AAC.2
MAGQPSTYSTIMINANPAYNQYCFPAKHWMEGSFTFHHGGVLWASPAKWICLQRKSASMVVDTWLVYTKPK